MPKTNNTLIKICGLTSEEQALQVAKLPLDASIEVEAILAKTI